MLWPFYPALCLQSYLKQLLVILLVRKETHLEHFELVYWCVVSCVEVTHLFLQKSLMRSSVLTQPCWQRQGEQHLVTFELQGLWRKLGFLSSAAVKNVQVGWPKLL